MANEARLSVSLQIAGGNAGALNYQSQPQSFSASCSTAVAQGPTPGSVLATLAGALVDVSKLTLPGGLARIMNLDANNFIEFGVFDGTRFTPTLDVLPGESFVVRLSRNAGTEYDSGPGTGIIATGDVYQVRADPSQPAGTTAWVLIEAFNR